jgi:DNA polymerase-3 subunit alpha
MDVMEEHRKIFAAGALKNGFDTNKAVELFDLMAKFAEYGFNKSHAVAYALIAFQTAFLKHYYPACFFSALLSTELSNTDKITNYIKDALNFGVETLPPDINESLYPFNVIGNNIRFGLGAIKNVGEGVVEEIVREREKNGPFSGLINFCERVSTKALNKRVIESMIKVGVFDQAESQNKKMNRSTLLHNLEKIVHYSSKIQEEKGQGQGNLFALLDEGDGDGGTSSGLNPFDLLDIEERPDFDQKEKLKYEVELMGIYVSGHPLAPYEDIMRQMSSVDISEVADLQGENKRDIILSGMFSSHKTLLTKKGDRMAFATLEDLHGKIECILFPKVFAQYEKYLTSDSPLVLEGEVNLSEEPRKFFPKKISELKEQTEEMVSEIRIQVNLESLHEHSLTNLRDILMEHRGVVPAHIIFESTLGRARFPLGERFLVSASPRMATKINAIFQNNCVKFIVNGKLESQGLASAMAH